MQQTQKGIDGTGERGSALLIVFVFAAILAIMLYREMPVTVFEAQRQKEQLLVDRGHEYVRAVQLFYRRNRGQYPSSLEQLESTNNIRYLRRRYVDPFTGKAEWRFLHAGPGGLLIDSKLKQQLIPGINGQPGIGNGQPGSLGASSSTSSFGSQNNNSTSSFGSSSDSQPEVVVSQAPTRPPAVPASGGAVSGGSLGELTPSSQTLEQNPDAPLLPPSSTDTGSGFGAGTSGRGGNGFGNPGAANGPNQAGTNQAGANQAGTNQGGPNQPGGVMQTLNPVLGANTTPPAGSSSGFGSGLGSGSSSSLGQLSGGGALAGIASKATGHTIKVINDQTDYALWEFYYNPATDPTGRISLNSNAPATGQVGAPGVALPTGNAGNGSNGANTPAATPDNSSSSDTSGSAGQTPSGNTPNPQ